MPRWPPGGAFPRASSPASPLVPVISSRILDGPGPAPGVGHPSLSSASGSSSTSLTSGPKAQRGRQLWGGCGTGAVHPPTAPTVRVLEMLNSALRASVWPLTWAPWPSAPRVGGAPATTACPHPALYPLPSAPCPQHIVCHKCQEPGAKCRASYSPGQGLAPRGAQRQSARDQQWHTSGEAAMCLGPCCKQLSGHKGRQACRDSIPTTPSGRALGDTHTHSPSGGGPAGPPCLQGRGWGTWLGGMEPPPCLPWLLPAGPGPSLVSLPCLLSAL